MGNESQKSLECRTQSNVKSDLLKVGAIDTARLEQYATKTKCGENKWVHWSRAQINEPLWVRPRAEMNGLDGARPRT